jgi:precorrin-6B methylase 2
MINTGAKYDDEVFQFSVGLNGVGTKAVNALSSYFRVVSCRDGKCTEAVFERGKLKSEKTAKSKEGTKDGTFVEFIPDEEVFGPYNFNQEFIEKRIWNYAYLNTGLTLVYNGQKYVSEKDVVIDVGCGSGILGITAKKLGAKSVLMTDIDECAVTASLHNIKLNNVADCQVLLKNLLDDESIKGNVIVCNIMAEVLIAFAPHIANNLLENGKIILSGILADRLDKVRLAYEKAGFKYIESKVKGEWSALVMQREN